MSAPRVVVVGRTTEYDELIARHGTRGQAAFALQTRGGSLEEVEGRHLATERARQQVAAAIPADWRRAEVERAELARFVFGPEDIVVVVGQDGLVANVSKYLQGQPVIGVNPLPGVNAAVLVPHAPGAVAGLLVAVASGRARYLERTMVVATTLDGQTMLALNEIYVGQPTHQSARYRIVVDGRVERQSSSGVIIGTGTGATGWCASLQRIQAPAMPLPAPHEPGLAWFVREPWPSPSTGATLICGLLAAEPLVIEVESDHLVCFGDGIESDHLSLAWGERLTVGVAAQRLRTVVA